MANDLVLLENYEYRPSAGQRGARSGLHELEAQLKTCLCIHNSLLLLRLNSKGEANKQA